MKKLILFFVTIALISCQPKEKTERIYGPDGKLKYVYKFNGDVKTIFDYAKDGKLMMRLKFRQDQFIDTIYYYDFDNHFVLIDSTDGKYFYGTQILMFDKEHYAYKGPIRFRRNNDAKKAFSSQLKFGTHTTYDTDDNVVEQLKFKIIADSSYAIDAYKSQKTKSTQ